MRSFKSFAPKMRTDLGNLYSLTALLKRNKIAVGTRAVNVLLKKNGYIATLTRPSSKDPDIKREYPVLSSKANGEFGENYETEDSFEPSIKYYEKRFLELMRENSILVED